MSSIFVPMIQDALASYGIELPQTEVSTVPTTSILTVPRQDINYTTEIVGYKWRPEILWVLLQKDHYFLELQHQIPGITKRALSLQLKELEKMDFVTREAIKGIPVRVRYAITSRGQSLKPVLIAMDKWGRQRKLSIESGVPEVSPKKKAPKPIPEQPSNILTLF